MGPSRTSSIICILAATAALVAVSGCTDDGGRTPASTGSSGGASTSATGATPSTTASPSTSTSPSVTASAPAGFSLDPVTSPTFPRVGGDLGSVGVVRVGRHSTYDRVVWEFPGSGTPTYQVRYVDTPTADGSGDVVEVAGDAYLEVMVTSVGIPDDDVPRPRKASAASLDGTVIAEATAIYGGFEGYGQAFVGIRGDQRPFKVTALRNPTRLVVDVYSR